MQYNSHILFLSLTHTHTYTHMQANDQARVLSDTEARRALDTHVPNTQRQISFEADTKKRVVRTLMSEPAMQEEIICPKKTSHNLDCLPGGGIKYREASNNLVEIVDYAHDGMLIDGSNHDADTSTCDSVSGNYGRSPLFTAEDWILATGSAPDAHNPYVLSVCSSSDSGKLRETSGSSQSLSSSSHSQASTPLVTSLSRTWETAQC
jgi:hypothetical protein